MSETASAATCKIGGAWAGPSGSVGFPFNFAAGTATNSGGDPVRVNFKSGTTYSVTAATTHTVAGPVYWEGYQTTPGDRAAPAVIDGGATGTSYAILSVNVTGAGLQSFTNFTFQNNGNSGAGTTPMVVSDTACVWKRCSFKNAWGNGIWNQNGNSIYYECEATNCYQAGGVGSSSGGLRMSLTGSMILRCMGYSNDVDGLTTDGGCVIVKSIFANNARHGWGGTGNENLFAYGNDAYGNGGNGIKSDLGSSTPMHMVALNNNFVDNILWGYGSGNQELVGVFAGQGFGTGTAANGSGDIQNDKWHLNLGSVSYPSNSTPYTDASVMDFRVTLAEAKDDGFGTFTQVAPSYSGTVGYPAIGSAQQ